MGKFMKKIILLSIVFLFTLTNANAVTTVVKYNNAGAPVSVTRGYGRPMSMSQAYQYDYDRYARPARLAMPARPAMPYGYRTRQGYLPPSLNNYNFLAPVQSATIPQQQTSRLNKNYNAVVPQKSYTMNGVTYYN